MTATMVQKGLVGLVGALTALSLWVLLGFLLPGTSRFIETRGFFEFTFGIAFMAGPGILALLLLPFYLWRQAMPPVPFHLFGWIAMGYTMFMAYQFAMYS